MPGSSPSIVSSIRACSSVLKSGWFSNGSSSLYLSSGSSPSSSEFFCFSSRWSWMTCANSEEVSTGKTPPVGRRASAGLYRLTQKWAASKPAGPVPCGDDAVLPVAFRLVERAVGGGHQALADRGLGEGRDAEADRDVDARAVGREDRPLLQRAPSALGETGGAVEVGAWQHDRKLPPAPACRHVDLAHALAQRLGELDEHAIADRVAEAVVDRLEVVEVGEHERHRAAEALGAHQLAGERFLAVPSVREAGEH